MEKIRAVAVAVALAAALVVALAVGVGGYEDEEGGTGRREGEEMFLLQDSKHVVRTDAGEMRIVRGFGSSRFMMMKYPVHVNIPMHIGFITMEPRSLFIPQYLDSSLILFIRTGEARVGHIYKDELVEKTLRMGDIYRIGAGSAFYIINTAEGQRLHIICSIHTSHNMGWQTFQSFFIAGGTYPTSVLSGFHHLTLSTAFNVSEAELGEMLSSQRQGPIVFLSDTHSPSLWSKFLDMEQDQRLANMKRIVHVREEDVEGDKEQSTWSFRKFLVSVFGRINKKGDEGCTGKEPNACNIYQRKPDFKNDYGWSIVLDESDYPPLKHDDFGIYLVNLNAGSMLAPHINPRAAEYGVVLRGAGTIQIVYPNGSLAMNAKVNEGDVFWIPQYFPFCHIASRTGPFEFFGFTTSARNNRPQFLVGAGSLLHEMMGPQFAAAFGLSEDRLKEIIDAQRESTILPSATVAPPDEAAKMDKVEMADVVRSFGTAMIW